MTAAPPPPAPIPIRRRAVWRWSVAAALLVAVVAAGYESARVYFGTNRHEVIPGRVYRCAQPSGADVREMARSHGIKTVLNLRGLAPVVPGQPSPDFKWYQDECAATHDLNVSQEDVTLSAQALPPPAELRRVIEVLDGSEYPILIHCKAGADRTGLVSAVALLLYTDATLAEAKAQLLPRYGHVALGRTVAMDAFFDLYEEHLARTHSDHTRERFRAWALTEYCPGPARSRLTFETPPPPVLAPHTPVGFTVKCENLSDTAWQFKPGHFAAVHAAYAVLDEDGRDVQSGRTGLRFETVPPGGSTTVVVPLRGLPPGRYTLTVEMHDATAAGIPFRTNSFVKMGDDSLVAALTVEASR